LSFPGRFMVYEAIAAAILGKDQRISSGFPPKRNLCHYVRRTASRFGYSGGVLHLRPSVSQTDKRHSHACRYCKAACYNDVTTGRSPTSPPACDSMAGESSNGGYWFCQNLLALVKRERLVTASSCAGFSFEGLTGSFKIWFTSNRLIGIEAFGK